MGVTAWFVGSMIWSGVDMTCFGVTSGLALGNLTWFALGALCLGLKVAWRRE